MTKGDSPVFTAVMEITIAKKNITELAKGIYSSIFFIASLFYIYSVLAVKDVSMTVNLTGIVRTQLIKEVIKID